MEYLYLTEQEKEILNFNIQEIKKFIVKKFSYYMLNKTEDTKIKYLKYSVLSSWFSDINTYDDFVRKFESFSNVLGDEEVQDLFQSVKNVSTTRENKKEAIENTMNKYLNTIETSSYKINSDRSGYGLSEIYLDDNKYKDYSIHKNIYFTNLLYYYLIKIDKHLNEIRTELIRKRSNDKEKTYSRKMKNER